MDIVLNYFSELENKKCNIRPFQVSNANCSNLSLKILRTGSDKDWWT